MAMKLICCGLLAVFLLGSLADAQHYQNHQNPQYPKTPQTPRYPPAPPQVPRYPLPPQPPQQSTDRIRTCELEEQYKIQCGAPSISASECEAINCCFDGQMCYYGKYVTLQCTKDAQMILVVARDATLPNIDLESIAFIGNEGNCQPVGITSAFAIYQFHVGECGTVAMEETGVIIYENRMSSSYEVAIGDMGAITRDSSFQLLVQCRYVGTSVEAIVVEVGVFQSPQPISAPGPLRVELRLANGQCNVKGCVEEDVAYSSFYTDADYPVSKVLRDPVYIEVRMMERTDANLVLTLGRCWANTRPYPHNLPQWDLLIDGCPYRDDNYATKLVPVGASSGLMYPTHHRRFIFKMFTFVSTQADNPSNGADAGPALTPLKEKVYIHCQTAVCQPSPENNCEPRCSRKRREIAASAQKGRWSDNIVASSHELLIIARME